MDEAGNEHAADDCNAVTMAAGIRNAPNPEAKDFSSSFIGRARQFLSTVSTSKMADSACFKIRCRADPKGPQPGPKVVLHFLDHVAARGQLAQVGTEHSSRSGLRLVRVGP